MEPGGAGMHNYLFKGAGQPATPPSLFGKGQPETPVELMAALVQGEALLDYTSKQIGITLTSGLYPGTPFMDGQREGR